MARNTDPTPDQAINRIVEGTQIQGDIQCESNLRIDGLFKGDILTKGRLVIGPSGKVDGTVTCQHADIEGLIEGKIAVQQLLSLKSTARIEGDIITDKLSIEPGAVFTGSCSMGAKVKEMTKLEYKEESQREEKSA